MKTLTTEAKFVMYIPRVAAKGRADWPEFSRRDIDHIGLSEAEFHALDGGASVSVRDDVLIEQTQADVWEDHEPEVVAIEPGEGTDSETREFRVTVLAETEEQAADILRRYGYSIDREDRHLTMECTGRFMCSGYTAKPVVFEGQPAWQVCVGWALDI